VVKHLIFFQYDVWLFPPLLMQCQI